MLTEDPPGRCRRQWVRQAGPCPPGGILCEYMKKDLHGVRGALDPKGSKTDVPWAGSECEVRRSARQALKGHYKEKRVWRSTRGSESEE